MSRPRRNEPNTCETCQREYLPVLRTQRFCTPACRRQGLKAEHPKAFDDSGIREIFARWNLGGLGRIA